MGKDMEINKQTSGYSEYADRKGQVHKVIHSVMMAEDTKEIRDTAVKDLYNVFAPKHKKVKL